MTKLAGVMGDPISHSLSPLMHRHWIAQLGLDADYLPYHVKPDDLGDALKALPKLGIEGVNLTIPHKEAALKFMDEVSDIGQKMGAINTVKVRADGSLYGTNTDGYGFINNLKQHCGDLTPYLEHCLVLGAGGAAKGIAVALQEAGAKKISISNRSTDKAESLANNVGAYVVDWDEKESALKDVTLLVNTTSLGMKGQPSLALSLATLPTDALVTDIVYAPLMTDLLNTSKARGNPTVTGIGMLVHQAVLGFELWFDAKPVVDDAVYQLLQVQL